MKFISPAAAILSLGLVAATPAAFACGTCGCSLNSDWASQGFAFGTGFCVDMRFDYFRQDQLRADRGVVDVGSITLPTDHEVQQMTSNRNAIFDLGYSPNPNWGVNALVPVADRPHSTIAEGDTGPSYSRSTGVGDVRVLGRYQGFGGDHAFGVQFGFKLPTGRIDDQFTKGPQAGSPVDRGLQLGSGTTDLLAGIFKFGSLMRAWGYFAQALMQFPLNRKEEFRPGVALNVSGGVRYTGFRFFAPQLQLNLRAEGPESGLNADVDNSRATLVYLSPGFTANLSRQFQPFVFLQAPVYQWVRGYQLEPRYLISVGLHYRF